MKKLDNESAMVKNFESVLAEKTDFKFYYYVDARTKCKFICRIHGNTYESLPSNFWNGHGCPICGKLKKKSQKNKSW